VGDQRERAQSKEDKIGDSMGRDYMVKDQGVEDGMVRDQIWTPVVLQLPSSKSSFFIQV